MPVRKLSECRLSHPTGPGHTGIHKKCTHTPLSRPSASCHPHTWYYNFPSDVGKPPPTISQPTSCCPSDTHFHSKPQVCFKEKCHFGVLFTCLSLNNADSCLPRAPVFGFMSLVFPSGWATHPIAPSPVVQLPSFTRHGVRCSQVAALRW